MIIQWSFDFMSFSLPPQMTFVSLSSEPAHLSYHNKIPEHRRPGHKCCALNGSPSGFHSAFSPGPVCCLCASCPAYWMSDFVAWKTFPVLAAIRSYPFLFLKEVTGSCIITACTVRDNERAIRSHVACYCAQIFIKGQRRWGRYLCRMHVKSGTKQAFSGSHTKLSAGQRAFFLHPVSHEPLLLGQSPLCVPMALG